MYYRSSSAAILCFDLTDMSSYEKVNFWVKELHAYEPVSVATTEHSCTSCVSWNVSVVLFQLICWAFLQNCKIYLCGTKKDLVDADKKAREVDRHDVGDFADGEQLRVWRYNIACKGTLFTIPKTCFLIAVSCRNRRAVSGDVEQGKLQHRCDVIPCISSDIYIS